MCTEKCGVEIELEHQINDVCTVMNSTLQATKEFAKHSNLLYAE